MQWILPLLEESTPQIVQSRSLEYHTLEEQRSVADEGNSEGDWVFVRLRRKQHNSFANLWHRGFFATTEMRPTPTSYLPRIEVASNPLWLQSQYPISSSMSAYLHQQQQHHHHHHHSCHHHLHRQWYHKSYDSWHTSSNCIVLHLGINKAPLVWWTIQKHCLCTRPGDKRDALRKAKKEDRKVEWTEGESAYNFWSDFLDELRYIKHPHYTTIHRQYRVIIITTIGAATKLVDAPPLLWPPQS